MLAYTWRQNAERKERCRKCQDNHTLKRDAEVSGCELKRGKLADNGQQNNGNMANMAEQNDSRAFRHKILADITVAALADMVAMAEQNNGNTRWYIEPNAKWQDLQKWQNAEKLRQKYRK